MPLLQHFCNGLLLGCDACVLLLVFYLAIGHVKWIGMCVPTWMQPTQPNDNNNNDDTLPLHQYKVIEPHNTERMREREG